jgi:ADYC domain/Pentapeptide repeats (9 copies)
MRALLTILLAPVALATGCATEPEVETSTVTEALDGDNGISFNGISFNGISFNGISFNGISFNGISFNGISFNGISFNGISFNGISFNGISFNGISFNGTDFIGAEMKGLLSNGASVELRIDDIAPLDGDNDDVLAYEISVASDSGWSPLCGLEPDGSVKRALVVPGLWNQQTGAWSASSEEVTLACRRTSVAKCIEFGYKSWLGFADHHHACVRMLRADYCGDGTAHTVNGTVINLYDNAGVQVDTETWPVDAEWGPEGALCFNQYRGTSQPSCHAQRYSTSCGSFSSGALLIDEYSAP